MELKSLILGVFFSMGIFAVKSGAGLNYILMRSRNRKRNTGVLFLWSAGYLIIFLTVFSVLKRFDFLRHVDSVQRFIQSGMLIHVLMAVFMAVYALMLLRQKTHDGKSASGWLLLVIPCPVCLTVILFTLAFLLAYFPDMGWETVVAAWAGFTVLAFVTIFLMKTVFAGCRSTPEALLGAAMLLISGYFLLSIMIMPQFGDMDKIYRLATYQGQNKDVPLAHIWTLSVVVTVLFLAGFISSKSTMRRKNH